MTIIEKTVPLTSIGMHDGDVVVGFRMTAGRIVLQVVESTTASAASPDTAQPPRKDIRDWINKWAGTMRLNPGETRESLRADAMQAKFGS